MRGCSTCGRIFAPQLAPGRCWECAGELKPMELADALALARRRQDRLRRDRVMTLARRADAHRGTRAPSTHAPL
jgi:hypothetical protein